MNPFFRKFTVHFLSPACVVGSAEVWFWTLGRICWHLRSTRLAQWTILPRIARNRQVVSSCSRHCLCQGFSVKFGRPLRKLATSHSIRMKKKLVIRIIQYYKILLTKLRTLLESVARTLRKLPSAPFGVATTHLRIPGLVGPPWDRALIGISKIFVNQMSGLFHFFPIWNFAETHKSGPVRSNPIKRGPINQVSQ